MHQASNPEYDAHKLSGKKGKAPRKTKDICLHSVWGKGETSRVTPEIYTAGGWPAASAASLRMLAGKPGAAKRVLEEKFGVKVEPNNCDILDSAYVIEDSDEGGEEYVCACCF